MVQGEEQQAYGGVGGIRKTEISFTTALVQTRKEELENR